MTSSSSTFSWIRSSVIIYHIISSVITTSLSSHNHLSLWYWQRGRQLVDHRVQNHYTGNLFVTFSKFRSQSTESFIQAMLNVVSALFWKFDWTSLQLTMPMFILRSHYIYRKPSLSSFGNSDQRVQGSISSHQICQNSELSWNSDTLWKQSFDRIDQTWNLSSSTFFKPFC